MHHRPEIVVVLMVALFIAAAIYGTVHAIRNPHR